MIKVEIAGSDYFVYEHLVTREVMVFLDALQESTFKKDANTDKYYYEIQEEKPTITISLGRIRYEIRYPPGYLGGCEVAPPVMPEPAPIADPSGIV